MRWLPRTLFGRILVAMFCGLLAVQAVGVWLMLEDRARFGDRLLGEYVAQRVANVITILDAAAPAERGRMVQGLSGRLTRYTMDEPWQQGGVDGSEEAKAFVARVLKELEQARALQVLSVGEVRDLQPALQARAEPRAGGAAWSGTRKEQDDAARPLPCCRRAGAPRRRRGADLPSCGAAAGANWPLRTLVLLTVLGLFVAGVAGWALRKVTRPLASLADAASGLARDLNRPPLPETGPLEVARVAEAFNAMQRDLKRLLETRAQALAGVSHDLRLPLTRLRLRIERLPEGELRARIEDDLAEMDAMIGSTLDFLRAGSDAEKPVRLNLDALLEGVAEDMQALGARVRIEGSAGVPILAQPQALRRCLANLLDNAFRYGGADIDMRVTDSTSGVEVRVEDRGPGIAEVDRERVFEPYVRLESSRAKHTGGTGLGLAIARAIARAGGGELRLEAREGGGLSAVLYLPRREAAPASSAATVSQPGHSTA